jgi:hypothetical protein
MDSEYLALAIASATQPCERAMLREHFVLARASPTLPREISRCRTDKPVCPWHPDSTNKPGRLSLQSASGVRGNQTDPFPENFAEIFRITGEGDQPH